jgi:Fe2+ transport system protein FeoA
MDLDKDTFDLTKADPGTTYRVSSIASTRLQRILGEMGVSIASEIVCLFQAPFNGPGAYQCGEIQFALRQSDAQNIMVQKMRG